MRKVEVLHTQDCEAGYGHGNGEESKSHRMMYYGCKSIPSELSINYKRGKKRGSRKNVEKMDETEKSGEYNTVTENRLRCKNRICIVFSIQVLNHT